ncbi:MAG TPA: transporter, partial [Flavobacterium sp.]|nr:transporter [Flavobacterium sp.]
MKAKNTNSKKIGQSILVVLFALISFYGNAQLKGGHILGAMGLQSGTQAPENTLSVYVPVYIYTANCLRNRDGDSIGNPDLTMFITGAGASYVSDFKILGANYGASILLAGASNAIQGSYIDSKSSFAFTDMYLQPLQLGWHNKRADFVFSYQMYIPTGKYELGGSE